MAGIVWDDVRPVPFDHCGPADRPFEPLGPEWRDRTVLERFEYIANRFPDRVAVDDGARALTYTELRARAYALAAQLAKAPRDRPVAVLVPGGALSAVISIAAMGSGTPLAPIDVGHPLARKAAILEEAQPSMVMLSDESVLEPGLIPDDMPRIMVSLDDPAGDAPMPPIPDHDVLAGLMFTSGSTGRAKGLAYRQTGVMGSMSRFFNASRINEHDVILALASVAAGASGDILTAVLSGAKVRMLDLKTVGIPGTLEVIEREQVTMIQMIPLVFRTLFSLPGAKKACRSLRMITTIGDRLLGSDLKLFRSCLPADACIVNCQGSTESGLVLHWFIPPDATYEDQETVPSGYLAPGVAVGMEDGVDEGEFLVKSGSMAAGAWQSGRLTPGPFISDPQDNARKIFETGDVVQRLPGGLYRFIGRSDRQIKILGMRADPADVEGILRKSPGVAEAVVIPRRTGDDAVFAAFVTPLDPSRPPSPEDLQAAVAAEAQPHMVPADVRLIDAIPRLPNFKADYVSLTAMDKAALEIAPKLERAAPAPTPCADPALAAAVKRVWTATLGEAGYSEGRPWSRSGGDSLKALQFMLRLEEQLGQRLPLDVFDPSLTPEEFVTALAQAMGRAPTEVGNGPEVFICPGIAGDDTRFAGFRRGLSQRVRFHLIDYPGVEHSMAQLTDREFLFDSVIAQIEAKAPEGPIKIAGYSLGGLVAFEAARRLAAKGRQVERLVIIDTDLSGRGGEHWLPEKTNPLREVGLLASQARHMGWAGAAQDRLVSLLIRVRAFSLLHALIQLRRRTSGHRAVYSQQKLLERVRGKAFVGWRPGAHAGDAWLIRAHEQRVADAAPDLGWGAHVASVKVIGIPSDHKNMFDEPHIAHLWSAFAQTLEESAAAGAPKAELVTA